MRFFRRSPDEEAEPRADGPDAAVIRPEDLLARVDEWRREMKAGATRIGLVSLGLLAWAEVSLNYRLIADSVGIADRIGISMDREAMGSWDLGIQDAEATAIVLAMLAVVASINIAVAVAAPSIRKDEEGHYEDLARHVWGENLVAVARFAAIVGAVVAGTRLPNPGMSLMLIGVSCLTVVAASATIQRQNSQLPLLLDRAEVSRSSERLKGALTSLPGGSSTTTFFARAGGLALFCAGTVLIMVSSLVLATLLTTDRSFASILNDVRAGIWTVLGSSLAMSVPGLVMIGLQTHAWRAAALGKSAKKRWLTLLVVGVALAWLIQFGGGSYNADEGGLALATWIGLGPLLLPTGVLWRAGRRGGWPMSYVTEYFENEIHRLDADSAALNSSFEGPGNALDAEDRGRRGAPPAGHRAGAAGALIT